MVEATWWTLAADQLIIVGVCVSVYVSIGAPDRSLCGNATFLTLFVDLSDPYNLTKSASIALKNT